MAETIACRLCEGPSRRIFENTILRRPGIGYYQCSGCGLTQTREPDWLDEAYAHPIHPTDTGILARNLGARRVVATFLELSGVREQPCLDFAGGYGIFVRLMRDVGFQFYWWDPYAPNLLAPGWEWGTALGRPFACTAFEVLEHLVRPLEGFRQIAEFGPQFIITSTELVMGARPDPGWHYLSGESGQHVSFFRRDTLELLGRESGYPIVLAGPYLQVFARARFPAWRWRLASRLAPLLFTLVRKRRRSLTVEDCEAVRRSLRAP